MLRGAVGAGRLGQRPKEVRLGDDAAMKASLAKQHLHGKLIEPEQVASVVAFLFTEAASAINGSTIPVEDGFQIFKNS